MPVSPNAIKTWRDGEVLSGAKSDAGDAAVIAEYLRLRAHRLHPATPYTAETKALRTVVRTREDIVDMRVAATNQLAALLDAHWPGAKAIFADIESAIALAFLTRYPTYASAQQLGEKRLRAFCVKHGYSGRRSAAELLTRLRAAPAGTTDEALTDAVRDAVMAQVTVLTALTAAEKNLDRSVIAQGSTRTPRSSRRCHARVRSTPPRYSPSGAIPAQPTTTPTLSPHWPVSVRSPKHLGSTEPSISGGHATNDSGRPSPVSPTTAGTPAPGPPRFTPTRSPAATTTRTPSGCSPARGSGSSTAVGTTVFPTTRTITVTPANCSRSRPRPPDKQLRESRCRGDGVATRPQGAARSSGAGPSLPAFPASGAAEAPRSEAAAGRRAAIASATLEARGADP